MSNELISTALIDDPDPEGCDVYGMLPLISEIVDDEDDEDDEESRADAEDRRQLAPMGPPSPFPPRATSMGAKDKRGDEEEPPLVEPSSVEIDVPPGTELPDDDDDAFSALTEPGATDLSPGEAQALIDYMRPLTDDEREIAEDPYLNDLRWVDDPAHADDVLRAGKGDDGIDQYLQDASYGEESAELNDRDSAPRPAYPKPRTMRKNQPTTTKFLPDRDAVKLPVVRGLGKKLVVEHANWLADQDLASGIAVRPRSYYEDVARLWARRELDRARIPTTSSSGWATPASTIVGKADAVLAATSSRRSRFSRALGVDADMGGWSPWSAVKKAAGLAYKGVKYTAIKPLEYTYKYGVKKPFSYTYKGVKYVGKLAQKLALAPIRAIVKRYGGTMASRRANFLAKQQGLASPTPAMQAEAKSWAKNFVATHNSKYGSAIASLMGEDDTRIRDVDLSLGDEMGLGTAGVAGLILLGPIGLIAILTGLVKLSSSQAPPPDPGSQEAAAEAEAAQAQADAQDAGSPPDEGAPQDADASYDAQADYAEASGYAPTITIEQLQSMRPSRRRVAQELARAGRIRIA